MLVLQNAPTSGLNPAVSQGFQSPAKPTTPKHIAETIFSELRNQGLKDRDIVSVSSELLSRLTADIQTRQEALPSK